LLGAHFTSDVDGRLDVRLLIRLAATATTNNNPCSPLLLDVVPLFKQSRLAGTLFCAESEKKLFLIRKF
jgi:hypothetical protein